MKVDTILQSKGHRVVTVAPHASMQIVIGRMILERVGAVVVSGDGRTAAGNPIGTGHRPRPGGTRCRRV